MCSCMCLYMCLYAYVEVRQQPQVLFLKTKTFTGLELSQQALLAYQRVSWVYLSLSIQYWDYKCVPFHLAFLFYVRFWHQTHFLKVLRYLVSKTDYQKETERQRKILWQVDYIKHPEHLKRISSSQMDWFKIDAEAEIEADVGRRQRVWHQLGSQSVSLPSATETQSQWNKQQTNMQSSGVSWFNLPKYAINIS